MYIKVSNNLCERVICPDTMRDRSRNSLRKLLDSVELERGRTRLKNVFKKRGIIVSCQAYPGDPMYGKRTMAQMAAAAEQGGAVGIRANGRKDIRQIKMAVGLPVIGLIKRHIPGSEVYITRDWNDAKAIVEAGAEVVALDVTSRENRIEQVRDLIHTIHEAGALVMADVSTLEEGLMAEKLGADCISTTLSGYTPYSPRQAEPDLKLVSQLSERTSVPIIAEGRIGSPEAAVKAFEMGATWVVVGSAITRPEMITQQYVHQVTQFFSSR